MALRSMTGFGRASAQIDEVEWIVEVRSVNHKGLDVKANLPTAVVALETRFVALARQKLSRGRVEVRVKMSSDTVGGRPRPVLDLAAMERLYHQLNGLRETLAIEQPVDMSNLLALHTLILQDPQNVLQVETIGPALETLVKEALDALVAERDREGLVLAQDLSARLHTILSHIDGIEAELPNIKDRYLEKLRERVGEVVERFSLDQIPEERFVQEVILFAERSDIAEELTRARAHARMLLSLIETHRPAQDGPVGKKLDFYFQELIRETNTMGSKSQSAIIASHVVEMRGEIDRLREQALNIA